METSAALTAAASDFSRASVNCQTRSQVKLYKTCYKLSSLLLQEVILLFLKVINYLFLLKNINEKLFVNNKEEEGDND